MGEVDLQMMLEATSEVLRESLEQIAGALHIPVDADYGPKPNGVLVDDIVRNAEQFPVLVAHHRECEYLGEEMASLFRNLLALHRDTTMEAVIDARLRAWDAHQWPDA